MNKITTTFQDGQILHAADLNPLITSINQAATELTGKANSQSLANTTITANTALTTAREAATTAASAVSTANDASETAYDAYDVAHRSLSNSAQAIATANSIITAEIPAIKESHYRYVRIVIVQNMPIQQSGTNTFDGVTYDTATKKFAFFKEVIPGQPPTLFATAIGANELFQNELAEGTWSAPTPNVLFSDGQNLYHGTGARLYQLTQTAI